MPESDAESTVATPHELPHRYAVGDTFKTGIETFVWEVEKRLIDEHDDSPYYYLRGVGDDNGGETKLIAEHSLHQHYEEVPGSDE